MPAISNFRRVVSAHGIGRQYRWRVNLSFPNGVATADETRDASLTAISTATPKSILGEVLVPWGGREFPFPGDRKFEPLNITFIGLSDDFNHTMFEAWSEAFNGSESNTSSDDFTNLYTDLTMDLLDSEDNVVKTYTLKNCWPQEVGELTLDQTSQDTYQQFSCILRYFSATNPSSR